MIERFEGKDNRRTLVDALTEQQRIVAGDAAIAKSFADVGQLLEIEVGRDIITQHGEDRDLYLIVSGSFDIIVNGRSVARRATGNHVGEMVAVQPTQRRSATVKALEKSVVLKISPDDFTKIGDRFPIIWRLIAKELARRLEERNSLVSPPRDKTRLFVISSKEALPIARAIQNALSHDFLVTVWTDGVFKASQYAIESLELVLDDSDFAVAVAQPDDMVIRPTRGETGMTPRDNVIFELGLFVGRLGRKRTFLVEPAGEEIKLPSDLAGVIALPYRFVSIKELPSSLGPVCNCIRDVIKEVGPNN